ncbi:MAG: lipoate--protein ligase family protein [Verrucomicrobia bacterium]|nr:lipoate--protein ligase family protein [Verrucomicrobiota bacterium]MBU1909857.1 lipoate--protein ligase family protein [Verrucomicrobiota bacterium]
MQVIQTQSLNVWRNLAAEEWLLSEQAPEPPILFLWQADPAVVIGKNQNPWAECAPGRLEQLGIRLARRVSGGGAVYHDPGNLNYAFILPRAAYRRDKAFGWVLAALHRLGIPARRLGRSGLGINSLKFSGTAFCYRGARVLHHGTLLVSADLEKLEQALSPPPIAIRGRAVPSERSPVMNLSELVPGLTVDRVAVALAGEGPLVAERFPDAAVRELEAKHGSQAWLYESTPTFEADLPTGRVRVEHGRIVEAGEAVQLMGCLFRSRDLSARLEGNPAERILTLGL